jgi:protease-4
MKFFSTLVASTLGALLALAIAGLFLLLLAVGLAASAGEQPRVTPGSVIVFDMSGRIPERVSGDVLTQMFMGEPRLDLDRVRRALAAAAGDDRIKGLWIRAGRTSASWAILEEVRNAVLDFRQTDKPVFASYDDAILSEAEYFVMSAADSIFAAPEAIFEFNGFYIGGTFYKNLLEKLNVEPQVVRSGRFKSAIEPFTRSDFSEDNQKQLDELLSGVSRHFNSAIAASRGLEGARVSEIAATEAVITARSAVPHGLLDHLAYRDEVETVLKERLGLENEDELKQISLASYSRTAGLKRGGTDQVALVYAVGTIVGGRGGDSPGLSDPSLLGAERFTKAVREAASSTSVKALVVRIDSPGGLAPAADVMLRELSRAAQDKPVVVSMGGVAASGGYWLATAADTILADPLTITGSIGVFSLFFDISGLLEDKLGITHDVLRSGPYADMFSGLRPFSDAERQLMQAGVDSTYESFLAKVAASRGLTRDQADSVAQGRVWTGVDAQRVGLVDVQGGLGRAIEIAAELANLSADEYGVRVLPKPETFFERLEGNLLAGIRSAARNVQLSSAEEELVTRLDDLTRLLAEPQGVQARLPAPLEIR